ncbi:LysM peptidoglycan-binding domain-containing protein [Luteimonas viscosa]|uniref:LysM peptidoglycan-binding domain-containing protein n=1 Tax=Luteimonas viscosa TaxID=1132694 RepID=A0A5D4XUF4_9GAMM|nr:LysM peptidoglycan-binding domain-containing protein [Luteimonas viscosa]TYT26622.1 LysM peptidoglycan-binding domain-containing protein [Luteimonas viscosa]
MDSSNGVGSADGRDHSQDVQGNPQASSASGTSATTGAFDALDAVSFDNPAAQRAVADAIATQTPIALSGPVCYTMQPGQTLQDVATAFGTTVRELAIANHIANPETVQPGQTISVAPPVDKPEIGSLSAHYETGNRGPGTVSTGRGDIGGVSYGSYQLSTAAGRPQEFLATEGAQWAAEFDGQRAGTPEFSQTWRDVAAREPEAFQQAQHDYIERTHYDPQAARVEQRTTVAGVDGGIATAGVDLSQHSRALQNVAWSTAVQHGPRSNIVADAIVDVRAAGVQDWEAGFDRAVIDAVYDERGRVDRNGELAHFSSNSAAVQRGVAERFVNERADAIAALEAEDSALREALGETDR